MFHMIAIYTASQVFRATGWWRDNLFLYCAAYYGMAFALVIVLAGLSKVRQSGLRRRRC
jgi:hypothetical protein